MSERMCVICGENFQPPVAYHGVKRLQRYISPRLTCSDWCKNELNSRNRTRHHYEATSS